MEILQDVSNWTRDEKIQYLQSLLDDEEMSLDVFPVLALLVEDEDPEVRKLAVTGLWDHPRSEMIDRLCELVRRDPSQEVRSKAVVTLGRFIYEGDEYDLVDDDLAWVDGDEETPVEQLSKQDFQRVKDFLMDIIRDDHQPSETRRFAVEAISFSNTPEVREVIAQAYAQVDPKMKVSAIFAMGRSGDRAWSGILLQELESPVRELQFEATRAVGEAGLVAASSSLKRLAESDDLDLKLEAVWSLGRTGGPGVHRFLTESAQSDDEDVREVAEAALEELELTEAAEDDLDEAGPGGDVGPLPLG
jgi:HEAT repeat protein